MSEVHEPPKQLRSALFCHNSPDTQLDPVSWVLNMTEESRNMFGIQYKYTENENECTVVFTPKFKHSQVQTSYRVTVTPTAFVTQFQTVFGAFQCKTNMEFDKDKQIYFINHTTECFKKMAPSKTN